MKTSKIEVSCMCCSVKFFKKTCEIKKSPNHFCSRSCSVKINNLGKRRHPPRNCVKCNKQYITNKTHRSLRRCECCIKQIMTSQEAKEMTLEQHLERDSIKDKHPSWKAAHIRNFNRSWNKDLLGLSCQMCGYKHHIELAHIKPISSFSEQDKLGVINDPSNILVLCPNHHWELDNNILSAADIPARD